LYYGKARGECSPHSTTAVITKKVVDLLHFMCDLVNVDAVVGGHLRVVAVPALLKQASRQWP